jgi:4-amino-4-deoxy-L-arabinose transferase-like glycosyltransferase
MADMFKMGLYAETEAIFTLLVSASLLGWHWGVLRGWPHGRCFALGYAFMALATLTKGIQAPPYFVGAVVVYLVLSRQWGRLFSWGHLAGMLVGVAVLLAWTVPYGLAMGWPAAKEVWLGDATVNNGRHILMWDLADTLTHLVTYPLEVVAATLPWSLLLVPYFSAELRRRIGGAGPMVLFNSVAMAVAWPSCWIPPGGLPRYFAPLLPCMAVLIGVAVERCAQAETLSSLQLAWRRYRVALASVMLAAAFFVILLAAGAGALHPALEPLTEPLPVALAYATVSALLALLLLRSRAGTPAQVQWCVTAIAVFLVITFTGVVMNVRVRRSVDAEAELQAIRAKLPPGQELVSLDGQVDSLFTYLYRTPIVRPRHCAPFGKEAVDDVDYFCFASPGDQRTPLPFAWEEIGTVNLDRNLHAVPERVIVVGRRLPVGTNTPASTASSSKQ